jgi:hypothetical protein
MRNRLDPHKREGQWPSHQLSPTIDLDAVCDDCFSSNSDTASKSHDSDPGLVRLRPTGEINRRIILGAHREQAEWRNRKQSFESVFPIANNFYSPPQHRPDLEPQRETIAQIFKSENRSVRRWSLETTKNETDCGWGGVHRPTADFLFRSF